MIKLKCEHCGKQLQAKEELAGRTLKCPNCQSAVTVQLPLASSRSINTHVSKKLIKIKCGHCGKQLQAKEELAGKTLKCPNCEFPVTIQAPSKSPDTKLATNNRKPMVGSVSRVKVSQNNDKGTTVVVQVLQQAESNRGMIGPAKKSVVVTIIMWLLPITGLPYFYIGQSGKGVLFLLLDFFVFAPLVFLTCGIALIGWLPINMAILVDSIIITKRINKQAISCWKFF